MNSPYPCYCLLAHAQYFTLFITHWPFIPTLTLFNWLNCNINFSVHCHRAASKANQALGMIKCNFKYLFKCSLVTLYKTFVCPHLEYCVPHPHYCKDIDTLENVQSRTSKLVSSVSTLSYESRLQLHFLYCRQIRK